MKTLALPEVSRLKIETQTLYSWTYPNRLLTETELCSQLCLEFSPLVSCFRMKINSFLGDLMLAEGTLFAQNELIRLSINNTPFREFPLCRG